MATYYTTMKFYSNYSPPPDDLQSLTYKLDAAYLQATREYTQRAFSSAACVKVLGELTKLYQKGVKLVNEEAPLAKISAVVGEFTHYQIPKELKDMFSYPCIIQFPTEKDRQKRKRKK